MPDVVLKTRRSAPPDASLETNVGEQLKAARERQGLTLLAIARSLRIPLKTLQALEEGEFSLLPADVYVRGFLKQYAGVLGMDPVPLLRAFAAERSRVPRPTAVFPWARLEQRRSQLWDVLTPRSATLFVSGLGLLAVLAYVFFQVRTYARAPRLEVTEPAQNIEVRGPVLTARGRTDPTAELSINGERTLVREDGTFEESIGLGEGVNTLRFLSKSIGGREAVAVREVLVRPETGSQQPEAGPAPGLRPPAPGVGPFTITVRADGEVVWVSIVADGKTAFSGLLLPGSEQTVSGEEVTLTSGKANRTKILVDGQERGVLAETSGVARDVTFKRNSADGTIENVQTQ